MKRMAYLLLALLLPGAAAAADSLLDSPGWSRETLLAVDMAADIVAGAPSSLDLLSVYLDADGKRARLRLSLVRATDSSGERVTLPRDASFEFYWDLGAGGTPLAGRAGFDWDLRLVALAGDLLDGRGRLSVARDEAPSEPLDLPLEARLGRDTLIWTLSAADLPGSAASLFAAGPGGRPALIVRSVRGGAVIDELDASEDREYLAHCALMHHGNQSLTYTDVFHGRWDDEAGSGFDEALQVHEATSIPGNFHLSGPLQTSAEWDHLQGDPQDFNGWLAAGAAAGWAGMITSAYAQHMMPFVADAMNDWAVNVQTDMTNTRYGYYPTVAWVPERLWLTPGSYPDAGVIDAQADNWLDHGVQAVILDDDVHCIGYDSHQIHTLAGSTLRVIPRDNVFTGRLHAGDGAGALAVLTGLAGSGIGDFRIAVYADDWEMAAEIGEWANSMPFAKETYDWFVWKCHDESAWLSTWKLADAIGNPNFAGVVNMNLTNGTYWSIGGTGGYGGANNSWYTHWAGFIPWVTGGNGDGGCAGGGSCQNYGGMWSATHAALAAAPTNAISEAGWYAMMTNLYETGWHDGLGGPISGWEHSHSAHVKNGRYFAAASHWGNGEWSSPGLNAFTDDVDGDGYAELIIHNERLMLVIESAGGRIVHMSVRDGGLVDTAMGCDNVYWYGTEGDYNDGNHVAGLSEVSPDYSSQPFSFAIDSVSPDSVRVTIENESLAKTLILRTGEPFVRCLYDAGPPQTYVRSGFSPSLVSLIWNPELERVWDPQAKYMGYRNPATGLFAGVVVGDGGASHSAQFSGRLMQGDEVAGDYRFEFYLYAASAPAPVGGEIPALEALAAALVDVLPPAVESAVYFPGTDRLRLQLDDAVELAAVDPTRISIDDDGDGVPELTLSGATSVDGAGWSARVDLILTVGDAGVLESLDTGSLTLLLASGAFADGSGLPNAPLGAGDAFPVYYGPPTLFTIDGNIDHSEWSYCELAVDDPNNDSQWSVLNELQQLYLSADESYLYLGLEGRFENFNGWLLHLDVDYGQGTGESNLSNLPFWDKNALFTYPATGIDFLFGSWAGANGDFYSIDGPTAMTNLNAQGVILSTDIGSPWPGSEIAIPWDLIYGLGEDAIPTGALLGISAAIAGGVELGGDVMPNNIGAVLPTVDNLALVPLDADHDGVPDKPDHQSPVLLAAIADTESDTLVTLHFSEALDPATAANPVFYRIYETLVNERQLAVSSATMANGDSAVVLVTEPQDPLGYTAAVFGIRDGSCYLNVINPNSAVPFDGSATPVAEEAAPLHFALLPNWPNPFNPATKIAFRLTRPGEIELSVYDIAGRRVARLTDGEYPAGAHAVVWRGRDDRGRPVSSGIYFALLAAPEGRRVQKMLLLK